MTHNLRIFIALSVVVGAVPACASPVGRVRFNNEPPVSLVNDRKDVAKQPRNRPFAMTLYRLDSVGGTVDQLLSVDGKPRAMDVNALGEVPDSTWFTNRIGVREVSVAEILRGPRPDAGPMGAKPWTVVSTKVGGLAPGIQFIDAGGVRYLLKFDRPGLPDLDTGSDVVVQRLLWAFGYNTPADDIVYFAPDDLVLAPDAEVKDLFGNKRPMTQRDLDEILASRDGPVDGKYRGLASRFLSGKPLGGYQRRGVRDDDPNDVIPHEHRRSVRGQLVSFAWLGHTDVKVDNTLDMFVEGGNAHFVKHYLVDFGNAMGVWALATPLPWSGFKHSVDFKYGLASLFTLGLWTRPWEKIPDSVPKIQGVGWFESRYYLPGRFETNQNYPPFVFTDRFDGFWGAKIMMRFTPKQIRAAVESADYRDPKATEYLTRTLLARQRKTGRYWFSRVNPLDGFTVQHSDTGATVCYSDLWLKYRFARPGSTRYELEAYNHRGRRTGWRATAAATKSGRTCVGGVGLSRAADGYTIVAVTTWRGSKKLKKVAVHMARSPQTGKLQIVGLWRR